MMQTKQLIFKCILPFSLKNRPSPTANKKIPRDPEEAARLFKEGVTL